MICLFIDDNEYEEVNKNVGLPLHPNRVDIVKAFYGLRCTMHIIIGLYSNCH